MRRGEFMSQQPGAKPVEKDKTATRDESSAPPGSVTGNLDPKPAAKEWVYSPQATNQK